MHLSLMRNADKSKLSKRKNPTSISYYAALGYLPEALMNFLGLFFIQIEEGEEMLRWISWPAVRPVTVRRPGGLRILSEARLALNGAWLAEDLEPSSSPAGSSTGRARRTGSCNGMITGASRSPRLFDPADLT